jgi:hypothetical protein
MKKITLCLMATCLTLSFLPLQSNAKTNTSPSSIVVKQPLDSAEAKALLLRLNEIKEMDKSKLSRNERIALQKEVRAIQKRFPVGGIYISAAGLVVIIILLLIFL